MTTYPSPSKLQRGHGPIIEWHLNGRWVKFRILPENTSMPESASLIGHVINEDHLEELYQDGDQFFRYAGGGRGFYWTQELLIAN